MRKIMIVAVIGVLLAGFNWSVAQQESLLSKGREVLVALAPVDPRALLMGDYMALDFVLNRDVDQALAEKYGDPGRDFNRWGRGVRSVRSPWPAQGLAVVCLTEDDFLVFVRLDDGSPLDEGEHYLLYRVRGQRAHVAAPAFYFQEGYASDYENARYGVLRLGADGRHLLISLADDTGKPIEPSRTAL